MSKAKVLKILIYFVFVFISLSVMSVGISRAKKPDSDKYFKGKIYGSLGDIYRADYSFSTFNDEGAVLRTEKVDIFLGRFFYVNILEDEVGARIYVSSHSVRDTDPMKWEVSEIYPEYLLVNEVNGKTMKFIQNTYTIDR